MLFKQTAAIAAEMIIMLLKWVPEFYTNCFRVAEEVAKLEN
jgi:hypothetical protein